jgi:non-specific serine/threonine protein kinase
MSHVDEALGLLATLPETPIARSLTATMYANAGVAAHGLGQYDLARSRHERALAIRRADGNTWGLSRSVLDLAQLDNDEGQQTQALERLREGLSLAILCQDQRAFVGMVQEIARIAVIWDQPALGARLYGAAEARHDAIGTTTMQSLDMAVRDAAIAAIRTSLGEADLREAWQAGRALTLDQIIDTAAGIVEPRPRREAQAPASFGLTRREVEVLQLLVDGMSDRLIAEQLFISVRTVEHHVSRIYGKLGVHTRFAAAEIARDAGLSPAIDAS